MFLSAGTKKVSAPQKRQTPKSLNIYIYRFLSDHQSLAMLSLVSTKMDDHLGIPGAICALCLLQHCFQSVLDLSLPFSVLIQKRCGLDCVTLASQSHVQLPLQGMQRKIKK